MEKALLTWAQITMMCALTVFFATWALSQSAQGYSSLEALSVYKPVPGNLHGSYMTMWSYQGLMYGMVMMASSPGAVLADQTYWKVCFWCSRV